MSIQVLCPFLISFCFVLFAFVCFAFWLLSCLDFFVYSRRIGINSSLNFFVKFTSEAIWFWPFFFWMGDFKLLVQSHLVYSDVLFIPDLVLVVYMFIRNFPFSRLSSSLVFSCLEYPLRILCISVVSFFSFFIILFISDHPLFSLG